MSFQIGDRVRVKKGCHPQYPVNTPVWKDSRVAGYELGGRYVIVAHYNVPAGLPPLTSMWLADALELAE